MICHIFKVASKTIAVGAETIAKNDTVQKVVKVTNEKIVAPVKEAAAPAWESTKEKIQSTAGPAWETTKEKVSTGASAVYQSTKEMSASALEKTKEAVVYASDKTKEGVSHASENLAPAMRRVNNRI